MALKSITFNGQNAEQVADFVGKDNFKEEYEGIEVLVHPRWIRIFTGDVISKEAGTLPGQGIRVNRDDSLTFS